MDYHHRLFEDFVIFLTNKKTGAFFFYKISWNYIKDLLRVLTAENTCTAVGFNLDYKKSYHVIEIILCAVKMCIFIKIRK